MRKLVLAGLMAGLGGLVAPAAHAADAGNAALSTAALAQASVAPATMPPPRAPGAHGAWGRRVDGRWAAGGAAPGGWNGYYRPVAGWSLPSYWINPDFYISDWRGYGLPAPAAGYGWSRYYDDAVLTDRYGRVADVRYGYDWGRYGGYDDDYAPPPPYAERRDNAGNAVAGAVVGGVVGGLAGNAIAGRGNRTGGTILGAGVGAIAGAAIGNSVGKPKRYKQPKGYRDYYDGPYAGGPYPGGYAYGRGAPADYDGRWEGTWYGQDGRAYSGAYDGRFQGDVRGAWQGYAPPPYAPGPGFSYAPGGYAAGGYASSYYSAVDYVAPTIVTETTTTVETSYAAKSARRVVRKARPRARVVCCPCGC